MKATLLILLLIPSCLPSVRQEVGPQFETQGIPSSRGTQNVELPLKPVASNRDEILFESINERTKEAALSPLKSKRLNREDFELRVWVGFGKKPLEGFVVGRSDGRWTGVFLESMNATTKPPFRRQLSLPESGWEQLLSQLIDSGLLTLPDSSQLQGEVMVLDGTSYVVEVAKDGVYRTYAYLNPDQQTWKEAKQMLKIADILYRRFGVER